MAEHTHTTGAGAPPATSPLLTGDALILALAAEYRAAGAASEAFDEERLSWSDTMRIFVGKQSDGHSFRQWGIETAIAALKADSLAGAMVQLELLGLWVDAGETGDEYRDRKRRMLSEAMVWSIYGVLASMTDHTTGAGLNLMPPCDDVHPTDVKELVAQQRAWLEANGIECVARIPVKRDKAGVGA